MSELTMEWQRDAITLLEKEVEQLTATEKEGWRYANELEQERVRLTKQVESLQQKVHLCVGYDAQTARIEKLENELRRMTTAFESMEQTCKDMQNPAKRSGPTNEPQVLQVQKEQELSE